MQGSSYHDGAVQWRGGHDKVDLGRLGDLCGLGDLRIKVGGRSEVKVALKVARIDLIFFSGPAKFICFLVEPARIGEKAQKQNINSYK